MKSVSDQTLTTSFVSFHIFLLRYMLSRRSHMYSYINEFYQVTAGGDT